MPCRLATVIASVAADALLHRNNPLVLLGICAGAEPASFLQLPVAARTRGFGRRFELPANRCPSPSQTRRRPEARGGRDECSFRLTNRSRSPFRTRMPIPPEAGSPSAGRGIMATAKFPGEGLCRSSQRRPAAWRQSAGHPRRVSQPVCWFPVFDLAMAMASHGADCGVSTGAAGAVWPMIRQPSTIAGPSGARPAFGTGIGWRRHRRRRSQAGAFFGSLLIRRDAQELAHRQSRRNCLPDRAHRSIDGPAHDRGLL